jgi:hypothetical protein
VKALSSPRPATRYVALARAPAEAVADCVVADMAPRAVKDVAVVVQTSIGLGLSCSIAAAAVDVGAKPEL